jgi:hypothetical protein
VTEHDAFVRRFVLDCDASCEQLWAMLRQRHDIAKFGQVLQVVVSKLAPTRRADQNRKMWKAYLEPISQQARVNGQAIRAEDWHLVLKAMFLPEVCAKGIHKWTYKDNGDRELTMSTGDLNEDEFEVYLHEIGSYATHDLGVRLPANPRDLQGSPFEEQKE